MFGKLKSASFAYISLHILLVATKDVEATNEVVKNLLDTVACSVNWETKRIHPLWLRNFSAHLCAAYFATALRALCRESILGIDVMAQY